MLKGESMSAEQKAKLSSARNRLLLTGRDPHQVVALARKHTVAAMLVLVKLMNGEGPPMPLMQAGEPVLDAEGNVRKIAAPVPPQVVARCAEIILERGYGKSPQAILVKDDSNIPGGIHAIPIMERIAMIAQARNDMGAVTDLEASEQDEVTMEVESAPLQLPVGGIVMTKIEANSIRIDPPAKAEDVI